MRHGLQRGENAVAQHAEIKGRVAALDEKIDGARVIVGADERFSLKALGPQKNAVLPDDLAAVYFRDVLEMLDNERGHHVARQKTSEIEAEGKSAIGLEVMLGLLRR